jgi:hypothetical protein
MWNRSETSGTPPSKAELADSELAENGQGSARRRVADRASCADEGGATTVETHR